MEFAKAKSKRGKKNRLSPTANVAQRTTACACCCDSAWSLLRVTLAVAQSLIPVLVVVFNASAIARCLARHCASARCFANAQPTLNAAPIARPRARCYARSSPRPPYPVVLESSLAKPSPHSYQIPFYSRQLHRVHRNRRRCGRYVVGRDGTGVISRPPPPNHDYGRDGVFDRRWRARWRNRWCWRPRQRRARSTMALAGG